MKKLYILLLLLIPFISEGQPGIIKTIDSSGMFWVYFPGGSGGGTHEMAVDNVGNAYVNVGGYTIYKITPSGAYTIIAGVEFVSGYSGDGGPATNAKIETPEGKIAVDAAGSVYFSDFMNNRVRKINTSGIITTIAGTGVAGFSGDGGYATSAKLQMPWGIAVDKAGNVFVGDNNRIRKISTSGIITTVAGNGLVGSFSDGVPAISAAINWPVDMAFDGAGNLFFLNDSFVCKINTSGIIHKVTRCTQDLGLASPCSCSIGPAISAFTEGVFNMDVDVAGNVYLASRAHYNIRKVNTAGVISTIAGAPPTVYGGCIWLGDGILSTSANLCGPAWIAVPPSGEVYFGNEGGLGRLCKISYPPTFFSEDFSVFVSKVCSGVHHYFRMNTYQPYHSVTTFYGDGTSSTTNILDMGDGTGGIDASHVYSTSGDYTVRHILYNGSIAKDTITYTRHFEFCNNVYVRLYYDNNSNCSFDSTTELYNHAPVTIRADSNGIPVDTLSATSGFYYNAIGNVSDVYTFRVLSASDSVHVSCPSSGVLSKTLTSVVDDATTMYFGLSCGTNPGFNLTGNSAATTGRHAQLIDILANNKMCIPKNGTVTMNFSPKHEFYSSTPAPSSIVGHTATWNFSGLSANMQPKTINVHLETPGMVWLPPGDIVQNMVVIGPGAGDVDTTNNVIIRNDTVKYSWDPNEITVSPAGKILNGTELEYTIRFENDGNDTARNIHVLDTLSDNVDLSSLRIVTASAVMNTSYYRDGNHRIVKFDFPNINLLDSSHHGLCEGMIVYKIKAHTGLANGTTISNRAGIYFEDNPVVMTNTVENVIVVPGISITADGGSTICAGDTATFRAVSSSIKAPYYNWKINGTYVDWHNETYRTAGLANGATVKCELYNPTHDTLIATSNSIVMSVAPEPITGIISGPPTVCEGATIQLATTTGGAWHSPNTNATVSATGTVTGVAAGESVMTYVVTNSCGTATAFAYITVLPKPQAGSITGGANLYAGEQTLLTPSNTGGKWRMTNINAVITDGNVTAIKPGVDTAYYTVSNTCGTDSVFMVINILENAQPTLLPNPVTSTLTIKANGVIYTEYAISNSSGKLVMQGVFENPTTTINTRTLPAGVYYIKLIGVNTTIRKFNKI